MYIYEVYVLSMPRTMPGVLHMLCHLILVIALCDTHIYFYFTNEKKNETHRLFNLPKVKWQGNGDALFEARCVWFKGHAPFISEWILIHHITSEHFAWWMVMPLTKGGIQKKSMVCSGEVSMFQKYLISC